MSSDIRSTFVDRGAEMSLNGQDPLRLWSEGARWYFKDTTEFETAIWEAVSEREKVLFSLSRRERRAIRYYLTEDGILGDRSHRAYLRAEDKLGFISWSDLDTLDLAGR